MKLKLTFFSNNKRKFQPKPEKTFCLIFCSVLTSFYLFYSIVM